MPSMLISILRVFRYVFALTLLAAAPNTWSQAPDLQAIWERDAFHEVLLAGDPGGQASSLHHYAFGVAQTLYPTSGVVRPEDLPIPPAEAEAFWHNAVPYINGIAYQRALQFAKAAAEFKRACALLPAETSLHRRAQLHLQQCNAMAVAPRVWTPLKPLVFRPANGMDVAEMMPQKWVGGRWVPVPDELRSRHDRKAGFTGHMFIHPLQSTAWFASDRSGQGHTDLFVVDVEPDGDFGEVRAAPDGVNSPANERTPIWSPHDQTLYFSSDRATAVGGFDVFACALTGAHHEANRLPFAINSAFNESHYTPGTDGWSAWFSSDRLGPHGALYRIASESETRHPVRVFAQFGSSYPHEAAQLTVWHAGSGRLLWNGPLDEINQSNALAVVEDGANLLALIGAEGEAAHTWFEWPIPVVGSPMDVAFELAFEPQVGVLERHRVPTADESFDAWPVFWSLPFQAWSQADIPTAPVTDAALPADWQHLADAVCWQSASADARWSVVRALDAASVTKVWPAAPGGSAWERVRSGMAWTTEVLAELTQRNEVFNQALLVDCGDAEWEAAKDRIRSVRQEELRLFERGLFWSELSQTLLPFTALRDAKLDIDLDAHPWFTEAESIMEDATLQAFTDCSWGALVATREVWRDWLFAYWEAMKALDAADEREMERAHWELEQSFALPVWSNLESAARALLVGLPQGEDVAAETTIPARPAWGPAMQAMWTNDQPSVPPPAVSPAELLTLPDTGAFTIQLGAFLETPDPAAFLTVQDGLKQIQINGWNKVVYGLFHDKDSARIFLQRIWDGGAYDGAFVLTLDDRSLEAAAGWDVRSEVRGWVVEGTWHGPLEGEHRGVLGGGHFWPVESAGWNVCSDVFKTQRQALSVRDTWAAALPDAKVRAYGIVPRFKPSPPEERTEGLTQEPPVAQVDASRWVIRVGEFENGASSTQRAAMLRLPVQVRAVPHGSGDAFISEEITGEQQALETLKAIQAMGFAGARLTPVRVD